MSSDEKQMASYIEKDTEAWKVFVRNLSWSKQKSNRDVLCLKCWKILKYEECVKHRSQAPDHLKSILTSKEFASETKFVAVARAMGKISISEGKEVYENPYKSNDKRGRPSTQLLLYREQQKKIEEEKQGKQDLPSFEADTHDVRYDELKATVSKLQDRVDSLTWQVEKLTNLCKRYNIATDLSVNDQGVSIEGHQKQELVS
jgi:hypothetical protein